jgi:deazaflavin-dependent oxidoreductase (nitroreductase family)
MKSILPENFERDFFRALNEVIEPAVRDGFLSPRIAPGGLIVLESVGFKSGTIRRTPLLATRIGPHLLISTVRGDKSFWVKNLRKNGNVSYFLAAKRMEAEAVVVAPGEEFHSPTGLSPLMRTFLELLSPLTDRGWAFALLKKETC